MDNQSWFQIRQASSRDRWTLAPKWELIALLILVVLATPFCLVLFLDALRSGSILVFLLALGIIVLLIPVPIWRIVWTLFCRKWSCFWIAEGDDRIVAIAKISRHRQYIVFDKIRVKSKYRRQSIGSAMIQQILKEEGKIAYGYIPARALPFFKNLGFKQIPKKEVSVNINFEVNKFDLGDFFYVIHEGFANKEEVSSVEEDRDSTSNLAKSYKSRPAKPEDLSQIRSLISLGFDLFLPFGYASTAFRILCFKSYFIFCLAVLFLGRLHPGIGWLLGNLFWLSILFIVFAFPVILFTSVYFGPKDTSKFWVVEYDHGVVGYARVAKHQAAQVSRSYTVFQHLFIAELHRHPSVEGVLVERILKYGKGSFYIAATPDRAEWLTKLGFQPASPEQFPPQYQFGAKLSALMKSINLAFHRP